MCQYIVKTNKVFTLGIYNLKFDTSEIIFLIIIY